jgi:peptidoglycan L-alanyl-D-glutamate endopeptidase CwlK
MVSSRRLEDLNPAVRVMAEKFIMLCKDAGIDLLVTSTYRDKESQDALYAQGRTAPGSIVTNAKGGQSFHQYRCALDVVPLRNGKCVWNADDPIWKIVGSLGKQAGLDWAGEWVHFKETAHFQYSEGKTIEQLQSQTK